MYGTSIQYGIYGTAQGDRSHIGIWSQTLGTTQSPRRVAIQVTIEDDATGTKLLAGYFKGDVEYTGMLMDVSDEKLKRNIEDIAPVFSSIKELSVKSYKGISNNS